MTFYEKQRDLILAMAGMFVSMYGTNTLGRTAKNERDLSSGLHACAIRTLQRAWWLHLQPPRARDTQSRQARLVSLDAPFNSVHAYTRF